MIDSNKINKNIFLVFMQQNPVGVLTKPFVKSIKFWLFKQNVLLGQKKSFVRYIFFSVYIYMYFIKHLLAYSTKYLLKYVKI